MATRKAHVGDAIKIIGHGWVRVEGETPSTFYSVKESCGGNQGTHYCNIHPEADTGSNLKMSSHIDFEDGDHVEVWICNEHGPEVP